MPETASPLQEISDPTEGAINANRAKLLIALVVLVGALGYFGFIAFEGATVYYYTVGEMNEVGPTPAGKAVRVSGKLVPETFYRAEGSTTAEFALTDGTMNMSATHQGVRHCRVCRSTCCRGSVQLELRCRRFEVAGGCDRVRYGCS